SEARLEMRNPGRRKAPQVVAGGALLAGRTDRLPLHEVIRAILRTPGRHAAVRLHHPRPGTDQEQRGLRLTVGVFREQESGLAAGPVGVPDVAVCLFRADEEPGPGSRLFVDRVELGQTVAVRVPDRVAAGARPVHVLPPFLAQVAPEGSLVGYQVDD